MAKLVRLLRQGNRIALDPTTSHVRRLITPSLRFEEKAYGGETSLVECFNFDGLGRLCTYYGYSTRIVRRLRKAGYRVEIVDLTPKKFRRDVFTPEWDRLADYGELRPLQDKILAALVSYDHGRIDAPPGLGKTELIRFLAGILPKAKLHVVARGQSVVSERIAPGLRIWLPSVGMVMAGKRELGRRITVVSANSLHHVDPDEPDITLVDECQRAAAEDFSEQLARYGYARMWGLSASHGVRMDGRDHIVEGLFGPIRVRISYQEAVDAGLIVPIKVVWRRVAMDVNPVAGVDDKVERNRLGIWTNDVRNDLIAEDARRYDTDTQVLVTCATVEHAVHLKSRLPEFELVHAANGMSEKDRRWYIKHGFLQESEPRMTDSRRRWLTRQFERGKLKKVIVNTVWNVGVSMNYLQVLVRGDGGMSRENDIQIPGRTSRINEKGKRYAILHDYVDGWDQGFFRRTQSRHKSYRDQGWEQKMPKGSKLALVKHYVSH